MVLASSNGIRWAGVAAVAGMYLIFLVIGWLAARRAKRGGSAELLLAGRSLPLWLAVMTMTATWVDGGYLNGTTEAAFDKVRGLAEAFQTGFCFGVSLILGGLFFAAAMRRREFTTLIDPFADRFGPRWTSALFLPALFGETVWCAALLVALGSTCSIILGLGQTESVLISAAVVTAYTMHGGLWSVAWTDAFQLLLIPLGLLIALPFVLQEAGGFDAAWSYYGATRPAGTSLFPPAQPDDAWAMARIVNFWEASIVLVLGGIPWNCYFQRVLACQSPCRAAQHSVLSGFLTIALTVPPLLLGVAAASLFDGRSEPVAPTDALPTLLADTVSPIIGLLGLAAIIGAVTSSYSASILSAGSMFSWNVYRPLLAQQGRERRLQLMIRISIVFVSATAVLLALTVRSVFALWTFTADFVFVLLFPQLVCALWDRKANLIGSITAFSVSLVLRLGGGEPLLGLPAFLDYANDLPEFMVGDPDQWYDKTAGASRYPCRVLAATVGIILLPVVSRLTQRWSPPHPLRPVPVHDAR